MFFITGFGRSGTTWLYNILKESPNVNVYHETEMDRDACLKAMYDYERFSEKRHELMLNRISKNPTSIYGEVNSYLRFHVAFLRNAFDCDIIHLVRNGRDVVTSMMNRKTYTDLDRSHSGMMIPPKHSKYRARWNNMSRFEKCCWLWQHTINHMWQLGVSFVRLEDLLEDYTVFQSLCNHIGISDISEPIWEHHTVIRVNETKINHFKLQESNERDFEDICGWTKNYLRY